MLNVLILNGGLQRVTFLYDITFDQDNHIQTLRIFHEAALLQKKDCSVKIPRLMRAHGSTF